MHLHKINIKLLATSDLAHADFVPIFHHWIQNQSFPNHLLIDVANYDHVHAGPGTLLVARQANIHMDHGQNQPGLLYVRKLPYESANSFEQNLQHTLADALSAAAKLQQEPEVAGRLKFDLRHISVRLNDRLLAPNNAETAQRYRARVATAIAELLPNATVTVQPTAPQELLQIQIEPAGNLDLHQLIDRLAVAC